jgi:hypothetical protein
MPVAKRKPAAKRPVSNSTPVKRTASSAVKKPAARKPAPVKSLSDLGAAVRKEAAGRYVHILSVGWDDKGLVGSNGAKWNGDLRQFIFFGTLPAPLQKYAAEDYSLEKWTEDEINGYKAPVNPPASMKPRQHQVTAIKGIIAAAQAGYRGFVEADNVGLGKGLAGSTEIPTPSGMTTMKDLKVGDYVLGVDGNPTKVIEKYISKAKKFYEIGFSDGSKVKADEDHRWLTSTDKEKVRGRDGTKVIFRIPEQEYNSLKLFLTGMQEKKLGTSLKYLKEISPSNFVGSLVKELKPTGTYQPLVGRRGYLYHPQELLESLENNYVQTNKWGTGAEIESVKTTAQIRDTLNYYKNRSNHSIKTAHAEYEEKVLPINPYVLGAWLGDGDSGAGAITSMDQEIVDNITTYYPLLSKREERDYFSKAASKASRYTFEGLTSELHSLYKQKGKIVKTIPKDYLTSSYGQRISLLKGLMDTDGSVGLNDPKGGVTFCQKEKELFFQVYELVCSLGFKATWRKKNTNWIYKGEEKRSHAYELLFYPDKQVFGLTRKAILLESKLDGFVENSKKHNQRTIRTVTEIPKEEEYFCISVDSPKHLYLCTKSFIPTHNTISSLYGANESAKVKGFTTANPAKALIICPKSVIPHWRNTIRALNITHLRIVVINYDQSKKLLSVPESASNAKRTRTKNKRIANDGKPNINWDIIIADESHRLKNQSQRTAAFDKIARYSDKVVTAPFVIWASATIGQSPLEIGYLAPLLGQMTGKQSLTIKQWGEYLAANGYHVIEGKVGYTWIKAKKEDSAATKASILRSQKADVQKLSALLFAPGSPSIRRNPTDIAGWPELQRIPQPYALSPQENLLYLQAWLEFRNFLRLNPRGKNPSGGLAAELRFRQKASLIMAPNTVDFASDLLDNGLQVAISVQFMETLAYLREKLEAKGYMVSEFSGANESTREQERLNFQKGKTQVMLFTVTEGISLHAGEQLPDGTNATMTPRATLVHDIFYSGIAGAQVEGRTHRDGQNANVYYPYLQGTVQEKITKTMIQRMAHMSTLSGDDTDAVASIEAILDTF